jgi:CubicO group peptidase (beta-lactamase class C family)
MIKIYYTLLLLSVLALVLVRVNELAPGQMGDINRIVADFMPNYDFINIALVCGERVVLTKTYGRNRLNETDVYASVSKPVTAMILMQLFERGDIGSIDDDIARYASTYRNAQPEPYADTPITFKHLLTHQSGVPHLSQLWNGNKLNLDFRPGTGVQYSTQGYGILGDVMHEITGKRYERLVREYIGDLVGATSFGASRHFTAPGGQVRSTIYDMALFAIGVMDERYVTIDLLNDLMFQSYAQDQYGQICLGWYCSDLGGPDLTLYHAGSNGRPRAYLRIKPIQGLAVAITGVNKSKDGAHDFEALSLELIEFLEQE